MAAQGNRRILNPTWDQHPSPCRYCSWRSFRECPNDVKYCLRDKDWLVEEFTRLQLLNRIDSDKRKQRRADEKKKHQQPIPLAHLAPQQVPYGQYGQNLYQAAGPYVPPQAPLPQFVPQQAAPSAVGYGQTQYQPDAPPPPYSQYNQYGQYDQYGQYGQNQYQAITQSAPYSQYGQYDQYGQYGQNQYQLAAQPAPSGQYVQHGQNQYQPGVPYVAPIPLLPPSLTPQAGQSGPDPAHFSNAQGTFRLPCIPDWAKQSQQSGQGLRDDQRRQHAPPAGSVARLDFTQSFSNQPVDYRTMGVVDREAGADHTRRQQHRGRRGDLGESFPGANMSSSSGSSFARPGSGSNSQRRQRQGGS